MAAPPLRTEISDTYPNPTNAVARTGFGKFFDYVTGLLGSTGDAQEARVALGFPAITTADAGSVVAVSDDGGSFRLLSHGMPSAWINSDFGINQRGLTTLADGDYGPDRTYALTQSGNVSYTTLTAPTDGIPFAARFTQPDATAKRFGFAQIQEARNTYAYRGSDFALNPKVRCSSATTMRVALLAHTGTADTLSKDVVNDWTSAVYEAGAFFKTGLVVLDTKSVMCAANTWTDVPTWANVNSSANNLIMFCWTEGTAAQNFTLDTSTIRAGRGRDIGLWLPPDPAQEEVRARRFFFRRKWFSRTYQPAGEILLPCELTVAMRKLPAPTVISTSGSVGPTAINVYALDASNVSVGITTAGAESFSYAELDFSLDAEIGT
ncbi:hypothetical protein MW7_007380 [Imbroritus primus]|uniref:Uncharacterized protein n=1 Tax=Imbroritus primus TaxID=3058603 RepID=A0ACD3SQW8_9BURK|nr:hypothetical protein MW7_007380 [Burkholderiaceae bacterium PBA]